MPATFTHADVEKWMLVTCTGTAKGRYPTDAEGDNIGLAVENDFLTRTGMAVVVATATHQTLCKWICELEYRKWAANKFYSGASSSTPGGSVSFSPVPLTFTWPQFDEVVQTIIHGDKATRLAALAQSMLAAKPSE